MYKKQCDDVSEISRSFSADNYLDSENPLFGLPLGSLASRNSNTALLSQPSAGLPLSVQIDWISLSFESVLVESLISTIAISFDIEIYWDSARGNTEKGGGWTHYRGSNGVSLSLISQGPGKLHDVRISLPGEVCSSVSSEEMYKHLIFLYTEFGARCTRIDLKADDYSDSIDKKLMLGWLESGMLQGAREWKYTKSCCDGIGSETFNFGSRRSSKYGRFYDRRAVTKGRDKCHRYEVEYKRDMAFSIFLDYCSSDFRSVQGRLNSILKSSFRFIKKKDKNLNRGLYVPMWELFLDRIEGGKSGLIIVKRPISIERMISWIKRSVAKSLLKMKQALGKKSYEKTLKQFLKNKVQDLSDRDVHDVLVYQSDPRDFSGSGVVV
jgi:DNA relaxase NicK